MCDSSGIITEERAASGDVNEYKAQFASEGEGGSRSREETVRAALQEIEEPTENDVVAYATERGVPESAAETILTKLVRAGEVVENGGRYRLL
jgi:hypothetical protein